MECGAELSYQIASTFFPLVNETPAEKMHSMVAEERGIHHYGPVKVSSSNRLKFNVADVRAWFSERCMLLCSEASFCSRAAFLRGAV